jgi:hypothetical protein
MHRPLKLVSTAAVAALITVSWTPVAVAQQACDDYSGGCTGVGGLIQAPAQPATGGSGTGNLVGNSRVSNVLQNSAPARELRSGGAATPGTLPFTGGEIVLLAVTGAAAIGVGAVIVASGRRRRTSLGA